MGYIITKVMIKNFKYVDAKNALIIDTGKSDMVVLNGQNGYGKTTFFDALELLFTSKIEHMASVANRQTSSGLEDLAFDKNEDIDIAVFLENGSGNIRELRRVFDHTNSYESKIYCDNEEITTEELRRRFGYEINLYGMGMYMSQTKSLAFLEKKLKDRKSLVAELVNTKEASDKVALISDVSKEIKNKIEEKLADYNGNKEKIINEIDGLQKELQISLESSQEKKNYTKLFPDKNYLFDKEIIDASNAFQVLVEPLRYIKEYISNYDSFVIKIQNDKLRKGIFLPKQLFLKKYYLNLINEITNKKDTIEAIEQATQYKREIDSGKYTILDVVCERLGIKKNDIELVYRKIEQLDAFNASLSKNEEAILNINRMREDLISHYCRGVELGALKKDVCPLCGASHTAIELVFKNVEESLVSSVALSNESKKQLEEGFLETFDSIIVKPLDCFLANNTLLYQNYQKIKNCMDLDVEDLSALLNEFKIEFSCGDAASIELDQFEEEYKKLIDVLKAGIQEEKVIINPELMEIYKDISTEYYEGKKPLHSISDIDNKIGYIANCYASESQKKLQKLKENKERIENTITEYKHKSDELQNSMTVLDKKYKAALKDYQSKIVEAIRIPVLIYSGKIIQNYPLGLGVKTKIAGSQMSFEAFEKEGVDVINILSTGQLNGLAISIMLAIRSVYGKRKGLDFILIDDPLQTIDDISAISLADLLVNSEISQAVISTHEDRKANMLGYKYNARKLVYKEINMKQKYLKYKNQ